MDKVEWTGRITAVQPRIRLLRSFDERSHSYQGYVLRVEEAVGGEAACLCGARRQGEFIISIGKAALAKHRFQAGMEARGLAVPVPDPRLETAGFYWNPSKKRYRFENFCYGPKSCAFYRAGATRKVPGRKGMTYTEEDRVDEDATAHRGPDD